jgi:hypothetical protein
MQGVEGEGRIAGTRASAVMLKAMHKRRNVEINPIRGDHPLL